jgi:hypothetical protein
MNRGDWLTVSLKTMGVYFVVSALATIGQAINLFAIGGLTGFKAGVAGFLLSSAIYIVAGWFLTCQTATCTKWCGELESPR